MLPSSLRSTRRPAQRCRRALSCGALLLALTAAGGADACTLDALLQLSLDRLLELSIGLQPNRSCHAG